MEYNLKFTQQEMQIVGAALGKLPYEIVAPLVSAINAQISAQSDKVGQENECTATADTSKARSA